MNALDDKPVQIQCPYTATSCPLFAGPTIYPSEEPSQPEQPRYEDRETNNDSPAASTRLPSISSLVHTSVAYQDYSLAPSLSPPDVGNGGCRTESSYSLARPHSPQRNTSGGCPGSSCGSSSTAFVVPAYPDEQKPTPNLGSSSTSWDTSNNQRRSVERDMEDLLGGGMFGTSFGGSTNGNLSYDAPTPAPNADHAGRESPDNSHSPSADDDAGSDIVTPFISKLSHLLSHSDYHEFIRWNTAGDAFIFAHTSPSLLDIFARFFRHSNVHSFVRQLNIYGFTRLSTLSLLSAIDSVSYPHSSLSASDFSGFSHPLFWRGQPGNPCDLTRIKPKVTKSKSAATGGAKKIAAKRKAAADSEDIPPRNAPPRRRTAARV